MSSTNEDKQEKKELRDEKYTGVIDDLYECIDKLKHLDSRNVKAYVRKYMSNDMEQLKKDFVKDFEGVPKNDRLRIETLHLLARLGIIIYEPVEEQKK